MIIAITGGSGFIGGDLVKHHIQKGDEVRVLTRNPLLRDASVQYFFGDLTDPSFDLCDFVSDADVLYHCAGEISNKTRMKELHIYGTQRLVKAAQEKVGRWVQLSSVGTYGLCRTGIITEASKEDPCGIYETTKTESDDIVKNSGIPYVILRPSNVFGDSMPNQSLVGLLQAIRKGLFFFIGKEKQSLVNYVHVSDVVRALALCGSSGESLGEVFNLSQSTTVEGMVKSFSPEARCSKKVFRLPERPIRWTVVIFEKLPSFPLTSSRIDALTNRCVYNSNKIRKLLKFKYSTTLEEGFRLFAEQK